MPETTGLREQGKRRRADQILAAARHLLREDPERPLNVERIAARAQVSPATVFNLVGTRERIWAALADQALAAAETRIAGLPEYDPQERARRIATEHVRAITSDPAVYRVVVSHWTESGRLLRRDGTPAMVECLRMAQDQGTIRADADVKELGALVASGCLGALHQWAGGQIGDRLVLTRCRAMVDLAFAAARPG